MIETPESKEGAAPRRIGVWGAAFIAFNGAVGAGIFGLPGKLDEAVGSFAPWLLLLAGGAVMLVALCLADLAARFDKSGGPQLYVTEAFGPFAGFQAGWLIYSSRIAATAANATVLAAYASALWPGLNAGLTAAAAIVIVTAINLLQLHRVAAGLGLFALLKLVPILMLVVAGIGYSSPDVTLPDFGAVEGVALAALYAFVGFEAASIPAGETRNPRRAIPLALLGTVALITLTYVLVQLAYHAAGIGGSERPLADLAALRLGPWGATLIAVTAIVSVFANITSAVAATPRLTAALADEGRLPAWFGKRSATTAAPIASILVYGALALVLAASGTFLFLAVVSSLARLFVYAASAAAVTAFDRRDRRLRPLMGVAVPFVVLMLCGWAAAQSSGKEWATLAAFVATGSMLYFIASRRP
ncbi:MAG: APC family permease [Pseudomonadota bacterium]